MTWQEFKNEVDRRLKAYDIPEDVEIGWIDTHADNSQALDIGWVEEDDKLFEHTKIRIY